MTYSINKYSFSTQRTCYIFLNPLLEYINNYGKITYVMDIPTQSFDNDIEITSSKGENVDIPVGTKVIGIPPIGGFAEFVTINKNLVIVM